MAANITLTILANTCNCGCGEETGRRAWFRPGHDARMAGQIGRALVADADTTVTVTDDRGQAWAGPAAEFAARYGSDRLAAKVAGFVANASKRPEPRVRKGDKPEPAARPSVAELVGDADEAADAELAEAIAAAVAPKRRARARKAS